MIKEIRKYVDYDNPINSCGSYKYESKGYLLFSEVKEINLQYKECLYLIYSIF